MTVIRIPDDEDAPLSEPEILLQKRLFGNLATIPEAFRAWLPEYAILNSPKIPWSLISGTRGGVFVESDPLWTAATANPAIGNGTKKWRFSRHGQIVVAVLNVTMGSTTTFGTGNWTFGLPTQIGGAGFIYLATGRAFDNSATGRWAVAGVVDSTNNLALYDATAGPGSRLSSSAPFTWATNDRLSVLAVYEGLS